MLDLDHPLRRKAIQPVFEFPDGRVHLGDEPGFISEIADPGGYFKTLLRLLDGTRTAAEVIEAMRFTHPALSGDEILDTLRSLDENLHLERCEYLPADDPSNRELSNVYYLSNFTRLHENPHDVLARLQQLCVSYRKMGSALALRQVA